MKIATYNVNGVNGRLLRLIEWLRETAPDVACLQEIKTDDTKFPVRRIADAGYGAIWHGQRAHARTLHASGAAVVLAGDFNVVPTDGDIYNAWAWREDAVMQPESRDAWRRLLTQGWTDATRRLHPGETIYTYWVNAFAFQRNAGFRMDFLLLNSLVAERLQAAGVDTSYRGRERPSDHAPAWVTLSDAPSAGSHRTPSQRKR